LTESEFRDLRSLVYRLHWVAKETRPEASGTASILAQRLPEAKVKDVLVANKMVKMLRSTASQAITIWRHDPDELHLISISDSGGIGANFEGEELNSVQNAHLVLIGDRGVKAGALIRTSLLSWRSGKCRRVVSSSLGGETLSASSALAEAEWIQAMLADVLRNDLVTSQPWKAEHPFVMVLSSESELGSRIGHDHVIDAKSAFDALIKDSAGSRHERRTAVELAIIRQTMKTRGSRIRWVPHPLMPADPMTKVDGAKGNAALSHLLKSGTLKLDSETSEMTRRQEHPGIKTSRSKAASKRCLAERAGEA
jgi:hypothetical protein